MNRDEKLEIFREAVKLADSGKYKGWKKVQSQLLKSGINEPRSCSMGQNPDDTGRPLQASEFSWLASRQGTSEWPERKQRPSAMEAPGVSGSGKLAQMGLASGPSPSDDS